MVNSAHIASTIYLKITYKYDSIDFPIVSNHFAKCLVPLI